MEQSEPPVTSPSYDAYATWHESADRRFLQPARTAAVRMVNELLDNKVQEIDRSRFRVSTSRVKSPQRAFQKLTREKYLEKFTDLKSVPQVIDDLVGVRLICNNLSDINTLQEIFGELPVHDENQHSLSVEQKSHRDYFADPKPSGYRAYHVNLVVPVPQAQGSIFVRVEVQARTLLQDGWGELTHEDTYKPGSSVPEWIVAMSLRMAELLAAVDNIAQDLRTGLDVETQRAVDEAPSQPHSDVAFISTGEATLKISTPGDVSVGTNERFVTTDDVETTPSSIEAILVNEIRRMVSKLDRPIPIALLSQQLTAAFGNEITKTWARFGGFKKLLEEAVPDAELTGPSPGYIHPIGATVPADYLAKTNTEDVPDLVRRLRTYDKGLPLISPVRIQQAIDSVALAISSSHAASESGRISPLQMDALAKEARTIAEEQGQLVLRPHAYYVLQLLNRNALVRSNVDPSRTRNLLFNWIMTSAERNGLVDDHETATRELARWLGIEGSLG